MKTIFNQRGFMMLNVVFLTLITALAAMILMNAAPRVSNPQATLRLTALYVANEQLAHLESLAAAGEALPKSFQGKPGDLKIANFSTDEPIEFEVDTDIDGGNPHKVTVTVSWSVKGQPDSIKVERTIWVAPKEDS